MSTFEPTYLYSMGVAVGAPSRMAVFFALWWAPVAVMISLACYKRLEKSAHFEPH